MKSYSLRSSVLLTSAYLMVLSGSAVAADFSGCTPLAGLNQLPFYRFDDRGKSVVNAAHPDVISYNSHDPMGERIEYIVHDYKVKSDKSGPKIEEAGKHREVLYVTFKDARPIQMTYATPKGNNEMNVVQEDLDYTRSGACRLQRLVEWKQSGNQISDVRLNPNRPLCAAMLAAQAETRPESERLLEQRFLDMTKKSGNWSSILEGSKPPSQGEKELAERDFQRKAAPLIRKFESENSKIVIQAPGLGRKEVEAQLGKVFESRLPNGGESKGDRFIPLDPDKIGKDAAANMMLRMMTNTCDLATMGDPIDDAPAVGSPESETDGGSPATGAGDQPVPTS